MIFIKKKGYMAKKITTKEFIEKARKIHGEKYDYSKVEYKKMHEKVCIICPEHGEFWQTPHHHLRGQECPKCGNIKISKKLKMTTEEFIEKARKVHGDKYDYSKVDYKNNNTKVCIIKHGYGEFWQTPSCHLNSKYDIFSNYRKLTKEEFIEKARKVHGDKYNYSKVEYVNSRTPVCIICPEHGEFLQLPGNHLKGCGCPSCGGNKKYTLEEFVNRAKIVHGDKYDYSKVEYVNINTKVCIICPKHGEFWQTPNCHINRHYGCPICDESHLEADIRQLLIDNDIEYIQEYKEKWLGRQFADFYLPKKNVVIECQGEGHFFPVRFNGISWKEAKKNYLKTIKLDNEKRVKCEKNRTKIIYYSNLKIKYPYKVITDKNKLLKIINNEQDI